MLMVSPTFRSERVLTNVARPSGKLCRPTASAVIIEARNSFLLSVLVSVLVESLTSSSTAIGTLLHKQMIRKTDTNWMSKK